MKFRLVLIYMAMVISDVYCENKTVVKRIQKLLAVEILNSTLNSTTNTVVSTLPLQFSFCKLASIAKGKAKEELMKTLGFTNNEMEILNSTLNSTTNTVVSTLPLQFSFCKLASIAKGKAKEELMKTLGFTNNEMIESCFLKFREMLRLPLQTDLTYVNKIYVNYDNSINMSFSENSTLLYGVHVDRVSYNLPKSAIGFINKGIASATYRRVENVLKPGDINNLTSLLLITAIHFKPTWEVHFDLSLTKTRKFRLLNNTITNTLMMSKVDSYLYYDGKDYQVLTTKLGNWGCTLTFVQSTSAKVNDIFRKLQADPDLLNKIQEKMSWKQINLVMPRIKIKSQVDLIAYLEKIGIKEILNSNSTGLNAILNEGVNKTNNIFISKAKQNIFIDIDEFGVSRVNRDWTQFIPKPKTAPGTLEVVLDQPFYFTVNLELSRFDRHELFNGVFYQPE